MKSIPFFLFVSLFLVLPAWQQPEDDNWKDKIDPALAERAVREGTVDFLVILLEQADLREATTLKGKEKKGRYVFDRLRTLAERSQAPLIQVLKDAKAEYHSFFIINALYVKGDLGLVRRLARRAEVVSIQNNPRVRLEEPFRANEAGDITWRDGLEWGITKINADDVWGMGYTGQGVIVGGQDTGVEWEHPTIKPSYRGWDGTTADHNYHWHDAIHEINPLHNDSMPDPSANPCGLDSDVPCDDHNHGTHTIGTMTGDDGEGNQIGVAPGATWIACRNMERGYGTPATYIECFEWFLAPTDLNDENPNPARAPHVINNSWSCPEMEGCNPSNWATMNTVVDNLKAAGIVVVVSAGNTGGNGCGSVDRPAAMFENSFSVGATSITDTIAGFSSRGPVTIDGSGRLKPNVAAPGVGVRSAIRGGGFATWSGTSMAGPHVAGLAALLVSANPSLAGEVETIETIIEQTARPMLSNQDCETFSGLSVPNAVYGYGRVDALAAVMEALALVDADQPAPAAGGVAFFPNPFREELLCQGRHLSGELQLDLFDATGRLLHRERWKSDGNIFQRSLNVAHLPKGVLVYRLQNGDTLFSGRIIKN